MIELDADQVGELRRIFPEDQFSVPLEESLRIESCRNIRGHCNIIHLESGLKADLYFLGKDPLHRWAIEKRRSIRVGAETVWIAPPEYVILRKLLYFKEGSSEKHLRDVKLILEHSRDQISLPEIDSRIESLGLSAEWQKAKDFLP